MFDLSLPEDAETLFGESAAIAVGSDFDPEALFGSDGGSSDLPIAAKIKGDPEAIQEVLDKVKATAPTPEDAEIFSSDSDGDYIVIGPDTDYLSELLDDGGLGGTDTYQDVVREDDASGIFFVNFDAGSDWLAQLAGDDAEIKDNLDPLAGLGITALGGRRRRSLRAPDHDRLMSAVVAPVTATRSVGAISRSRPRRPADT